MAVSSMSLAPPKYLLLLGVHAITRCDNFQKGKPNVLRLLKNTPRLSAGWGNKWWGCSWMLGMCFLYDLYVEKDLYPTWLRMYQQYKTKLPPVKALLLLPQTSGCTCCGHISQWYCGMWEAANIKGPLAASHISLSAQHTYSNGMVVASNYSNLIIMHNGLSK